MVSRRSDPWAPDEDLPLFERRFQLHLARRVCSTCPVRLPCLMEALAELPRVESLAMRGGLTPREQIELAKSMGWKWRKEAQHGTRSAYVAGCRCDECRRAHREYEHERRLQKPQQVREPQPRGPWTPEQRVMRRVTPTPQTPRAIAKQVGMKAHRVREILVELERTRDNVITTPGPGGATAYLRRVTAHLQVAASGEARRRTRC